MQTRESLTSTQNILDHEEDEAPLQRFNPKAGLPVIRSVESYLASSQMNRKILNESSNIPGFKIYVLYSTEEENKFGRSF